MSINEVTGPLSAATKRTASRDRLFGNLPTDKPKKVASATKKAYELLDSDGEQVYFTESIREAKSMAKKNGYTIKVHNDQPASPNFGRVGEY